MRYHIIYIYDVGRGGKPSQNNNAPPAVMMCLVLTRAVASPTLMGGGGGRKKFRWGQIFMIFLKFEVKNRRKSVEEAKP